MLFIMGKSYSSIRITTLFIFASPWTSRLILSPTLLLADRSIEFSLARESNFTPRECFNSSGDLLASVEKFKEMTGYFFHE